MANYTLKIEMTPAEAALIDKVGVLADEQRVKDTRTRILAERGRAIDQIKRLYAVVMGYALTSCVTNAYLCSRVLEKDTLEALSILIAPVIVFVSLISLFYLGAERLLDRKYLQENEPQAPTPKRLLTDLTTLSISAAWFVILANIFQPPLAGSSKLTLANLHDFQAHFIKAIFILYILDIVLLAVQLIAIAWQAGLRAATASEVFVAHAKWFGINVVSLLVLWGIMNLSDGIFGSLEIDVVASIFAGFHVLRFFVDFLWTFRFYYPPDSW